MMMSIRIVVLVLLMATCSVELRAASFDCTKAKSRAELIICSDSELSALDDELAKIYSKAKSVASSPVDFKAQGEREWKRREATCLDKKCLLAWYSERRDQLLGTINAQSSRPLPPPPPAVKDSAIIVQQQEKAEKGSMASLPNKQKTYKVIGKGYYGCVDKEKFKRLRDLLMKGEDQLFLREMDMNVKRGECVMLTMGEKVLLEEAPTIPGMIRIKKTGSLTSHWTTTNAIER